MTIIWCTVPEILSVTDIIFTILDHFLPFYPPPSPNNTKNQYFEELKKISGDIIILHKCTKNHDHILYCSLDMARNGCNYYFSFWTIFCPFTSLTAPKIKIFKKRKKAWRYHHFTYVYQRLYHMIYHYWDMVCDGRTGRRADGQADGQMEKVTYRGGCPN